MGMLLVITILDILLVLDMSMWEKQCHKPPITGNGKNTTYKNCDGGWFIVVLPTLIDNPTTMNNHGLYVMDIDIDM